jgi:hypothetical protein
MFRSSATTIKKLLGIHSSGWLREGELDTKISRAVPDLAAGTAVKPIELADETVAAKLYLWWRPQRFGLVWRLVRPALQAKT